MMEYTAAAVAMFLAGLGLNLKFNPVFRKNQTAIMVATGIVVVAQLVFDNLTVATGFWHFNDAATLGIRIPFMPLENLFFGLALFLFTALFWEWSPRSHRRSSG